MCHISCLAFCAKNLDTDDINGKRIIEVGSYNVNGSIRPIVELLKPDEYIGIDIEEGPDVDMVCDAENMLETFGEESFDVVISNELLEHVKNWRLVISNMKRICRPNGIILITTRSKGFNYHAYPHDYWRYEVSDMQKIFGDCDIITLEADNQAPGVFLKAKRPGDFVEKDLSEYELYSIVANKRIKNISENNLHSARVKLMRLRQKCFNVAYRIIDIIFAKIFRI